MGDWGDTFSSAFEAAAARRRASRLDRLQEEMLRGQMNLRESADQRADAFMEERKTNAATLRDRVGYLDRFGALRRETAPLESLGKSFPEAGAAPDVNRAMQFDESMARDPASADVQPPLVADDGSMMGPYEPGQQPTPREQRATAISSAFSAFGGAQQARIKALEALKLKLGAQRVHQTPPKTTALDIQLREVNALRGRADKLEQGYVWDDAQKAFVRQVMTPEQEKNARATAARWRAQADANEKAIRDAYGKVGAVGPAATGPAAMSQVLAGQGMEADQIAEQLRGMFSPEELQLFLGDDGG